MNEQTDPEVTEVATLPSSPPLDPKPPISGPKAPILLGSKGITITNTEELVRFAGIALRSGLAPKGFDSAEKIMIAIQLGAELGLAPMAALRNIAVVNGRPALWGDVSLALVQASGHCESFYEEEIGDRNSDAFGYVCVTKRRGHERPFKTVFTVADAKRAGLFGKPGPWQQYPQRMLQQRARGFALRDAYPDVLLGVISAEEAGDTPREPEKNVTPKLDELDAPKP